MLVEPNYARAGAGAAVRCEQVRTLLGTRTFHDAIAGFLLPDDASQQRP
jgi:hypothetical protein